MISNENSDELHLLQRMSLQDFEILYCNRFTGKSDLWNLSRHSHEHIEIIYFLEGKARILDNEKSLEISYFNLLLYPENVLHQEILDLNSKQEIILFGIKLPQNSNLPQIIRIEDRNEHLKWLFLELIRNSEESIMGKQRVMSHLIHLIMFYLVQEYKRNTIRENDHIDFIIDYINENYANNIKIDDLLKLSNVSRSYMNRSFKKRMGRTPINYLNKIRVEAAKHLLITRDRMSVSEVAAEVGIKENKYFCKIFKDYTQLTPTEYRKLIPK